MISNDEAEIAARLDRIRAKLEWLRDTDPRLLESEDLAMFGARAHNYRLGRCLSEHRVAKAERRLGAQLPLEYRLFLTRLGHGGAGPYYGLFRLAGLSRFELFRVLLSEDITALADVRKPFRWTEATNPYDWDDPCHQEGVTCLEDNESSNDEPPEMHLSVPGALYICHFGCAIRFLLVVNGPCRGEVWRDAQSDGEGILPECNEDGQHLGFLDWYEKWLAGLRLKPPPNLPPADTQAPGTRAPRRAWQKSI